MILIINIVNYGFPNVVQEFAKVSIRPERRCRNLSSLYAGWVVVGSCLTEHLFICCTYFQNLSIMKPH